MTQTQPSASDPSYTLKWPAHVLRTELAWVLQHAPPVNESAAAFILEEAFESDEPRDELQSFGSRDPWDTSTGAVLGRWQSVVGMLRWIQAHADELPEHGARPYWPERNGRVLSSAPLESEQLRAGWTQLVDRFSAAGYLARIAPWPCVDGDNPPPDPDEVLDLELGKRLGAQGLWPLAPKEWDEDTFYALVEAIGDLVARPRARYMHTYSNCGWHYSQFALTPGQALYRSEVNDLFYRAGTGLQLADSGADVNRLVHIAGDDRDQLLELALQTPDPAERNAVDHAVAMFRGRDTSPVAKRAAIVELAGILETRRQSLNDSLLTKDEDALFFIANKFNLRHRTAAQYKDYAEEFLDWIFWWYLSTIRLTDQIAAQQASRP